jgi:hypothetical protein
MIPSSTGGRREAKRIRRNYSVIKCGKIPPNPR